MIVCARYHPDCVCFLILCVCVCVCVCVWQNAWLDSFAEARLASGRASLSLQWGYVANVGQAARPELLRRAGDFTISRLEAIAFLRVSLEVQRAPAAVLLHRIDVSPQHHLLPATYTSKRPVCKQAALVWPPSKGVCIQTGIPRILPPQSPAQRRAGMEAMVMEVVLELTGVIDGTLTTETPLMDAGVDSLAATELSSRLRTRTNAMSLSPTLVFEQPTARKIAAHILAQVECAPAVDLATRCSAQTPLERSLLLIGLQGRWPGGCVTKEARAELQSACGDAVGSVPWTRWVLEEAVDMSALSERQRECVQHGGFIPGIQVFDNTAFHISSAEAKWMDPQQRLLLELGYASLHESSHRRATLMGGGCGVFLGIERPDWALVKPPSSRASVYAVTAENTSVAAGRISFVLGLQGPCASIDTACSSALAALQSAAQAKSGCECDVALALAVSLKLAPLQTFDMALAGMLSVDGRCKTLDAHANGMIRAEGVGSLVVAVGNTGAALQGSAVRQDGLSASLTAPSGSAQCVLLRSALSRAMLSPEDVEYVEAHGTGTALGDPTEIGALAAVHESVARAKSLVLGAAKANSGHAEGSSGQVGLLKVRHVVDNRITAGNAQLRVLNPHLVSRTMHLHFSMQSGVLVEALSSSISAFGYSGTIAHAIIKNIPAAAADVKACGCGLSKLVLRRHPSLSAARAHPMCHERLPTATTAATFRTSASSRRYLKMVEEHLVNYVVFAPAVSHVEMVSAAVSQYDNRCLKEGVQLQYVQFINPIVPDNFKHIDCILQAGRYELRCEMTLFSNGRHVKAESVKWLPLNATRLLSLRNACGHAFDMKYDEMLASNGVQLHPAYQVNVCPRHNSSGLAISAVTDRKHASGCLSHPADLDAMLQLAMFFATPFRGPPKRIPQSIAETQHRGCTYPSRLWSLSIPPTKLNYCGNSALIDLNLNAVAFQVHDLRYFALEKLTTRCANATP